MSLMSTEYTLLVFFSQKLIMQTNEGKFILQIILLSLHIIITNFY